MFIKLTYINDICNVHFLILGHDVLNNLDTQYLHIYFTYSWDIQM